MEYIKNRVLKIVQKPYEAAEEFAAEVNAFIMAKGNDCEIEPREIPGFHCAYLWHIVRIIKPESMADIFHLRGEDIKCLDCPYLLPQIDARKKHNICQLTGASVERHSQACETIFTAAWQGRIDVAVRDYEGRIKAELYADGWNVDREAVLRIQAEAVEALAALPVTSRGEITVAEYPELLSSK